MNLRTILALALGCAIAAIAALAAHAAPPWRNQGQAIMIPPSAMAELLRCRQDQRPEDECFDRMVRAIDAAHQVAGTKNAPVL